MTAKQNLKYSVGIFMLPRDGGGIMYASCACSPSLNVEEIGFKEHCLKVYKGISEEQREMITNACQEAEDRQDRSSTLVNKINELLKQK